MIKELLLLLLLLLLRRRRRRLGMRTRYVYIVELH
jgi:hypothetical protein